jgi:hypothetical protein
LLVTLAAVVLVAAAAGSAVGFTDDSTAGGTTFVTAANALEAAGCAAGFGDGSFGYNANVTRGQDAIFQMACAPGAAYKNAGSPGTPTSFTAPSTTPTTLGTETITAGINPGGVQVLLVHAHATLGANPTPGGVAGTSATAVPTVSVAPAAGGAATSPSSVSCLPVTVPTGFNAVSLLAASGALDCDGGFVVPTGTTLTVTFSATVSAVSNIGGTGSASLTPGTLTAWTTPRGNTVSSTTSLS